jgi:hypothetical protein
MHERIEAAHGGTVTGSQAPAGTSAQAPLASVRLHSRHDVNSFSCPRSARVEDFIKRRAAHYEAKNYAKVFVFEAPNDNTKIEGYYTLAAYSLVHAEAITALSNSKRRQIEGSIPVPLVLVGYMGRDVHAPIGTGADLILDAARRAHSNSDIGSWGLIYTPRTTIAVWLNGMQTR